MKVETKCQICETVFLARPTDLKRGHSKYCSRPCITIGSNNTKASLGLTNKDPNTNCAQCSKGFYIGLSKSKQSKSGLHFCSRVCKDMAQRIGGIKEIMPPHFGIVGSNYRTIAFRHYEAICMSCGYCKVPEVLEVHHKDKDRSNNDLSNLEVLCPTCHQEHHYREKSGKWA